MTTIEILCGCERCGNEEYLSRGNCLCDRCLIKSHDASIIEIHKLIRQGAINRTYGQGAIARYQQRIDGIKCRRGWQ